MKRVLVLGEEIPEFNKLSLEKHIIYMGVCEGKILNIFKNNK